MRTAEQIDLHYRSTVFGDVFKLSVRDGYDSEKFVKQLMTSKEFVWVLTMKQGQEWCDDAFLYYHLTHNYTPFEKGQTLDPYAMWFIGYTYEYWMLTKNKKPSQVYRILPFRQFYGMFPFYHTQDWDFIISDATNQYEERHRKRKRE